MNFGSDAALTIVATAFLVSIPALADSTYTVPVPPALKKVATFSIHNLSFCTQNNHVHLEYNLPAELTGVENQTISLDGIETGYNPIELSGPHGSGLCAPSSQGFSCNVRMNGLQFDNDSLEKRLNAISLTTEELADREQVARIFSSDPVGVVSYTFH